MDIVVIGTTEFLPGFGLAGVRRLILANQDTVLDILEQHKDAGIIVLDEELTHSFTAAELETIETSVSPVIIILTKHSAEHEARLRRAIVSALGIDLLTEPANSSSEFPTKQTW